VGTLKVLYPTTGIADDLTFSFPAKCSSNHSPIVPHRVKELPSRDQHLSHFQLVDNTALLAFFAVNLSLLYRH
jgi:hypothetical protein